MVYQSNLENSLEKLGLKPDIKIPYYPLFNIGFIEKYHQQNIKVNPWTRNHKTYMLNLHKLGVDVIIDDHSDRVMQIKE